MNYELKDKITTTKELLSELEIKGWQEIEHLQAQIANLAEGSANDKLRQLLKNLLTSYYVFAGGIEALVGEPIENTIAEQELQVKEPTVGTTINLAADGLDSTDDFSIEDEKDDYEVSDPFEYFVDFDEPVGEPLTDEDLYNN